MKLRMTGSQHSELNSHLFPGDMKEAVAFALCGRRGSDVLVVQQVIPIPYEDCDRHTNYITWRTDALVPVLEAAEKSGLGVMKIHSHPGGYSNFSAQDDRADAELFPSIHDWIESTLPHASAIMLPEGRVFGRSVDARGAMAPLELVSVVGTDIQFYPHQLGNVPDFALRNGQAFGAKTTKLMSKLKVAVVGCSGTGSPLIEALARHGIGHLVLIDPDKIGIENLNRILNATTEDLGRLKVDVAGDAVERMGLGTTVERIPTNLLTPDAVRAVAGCDVVFGAMDGAEGRHYLNRLATCYGLPYFDVGVRLIADGRGGVEQICGSVHYLEPGGSSLLSRNAITMAQVDAEALRRTDPEEYERRREERYISGVNEAAPAVISVNMHYASLAVLEFLARVHPYRDDPNDAFAQFGSSLTQYYFYNEAHPEPCAALARYLGKGDLVPLLNMPALSE